MALEDGFGRLIMHGLAQYHGMHSVTRCVGDTKTVCVLPGASRQLPGLITCSDVVAALSDSGGLSCALLKHYMQAAAEGHPGYDDDYVIV
jgi:hypothetical protein